MKNIDKWRETKWTFRDNKLIPFQVGRYSVRTAELQIASYQAAFEQYADGPIADLGCGEVPMYGLYQPMDENPFCVDWGGGEHDVSHADEISDLNLYGSIGKSRKYGTVCAWDVIEHLWQPMGLFTSASHLLRPGGHFICGTPFMYWIHEAPHDYLRFTEFALRKYTELANMEVVSCVAYGDATDVLYDMTCKTGFGQLTPPVANKERYPLGYTLIARKP